MSRNAHPRLLVRQARPRPCAGEERNSLVDAALACGGGLDDRGDPRARGRRFREHVEPAVGAHQVRIVADREPAILGQLREVWRAVRHPDEHRLEPNRQRIGGALGQPTRTIGGDDGRADRIELEDQRERRVAVLVVDSAVRDELGRRGDRVVDQLRRRWAGERREPGRYVARSSATSAGTPSSSAAARRTGSPLDARRRKSFPGGRRLS